MRYTVNHRSIIRKYPMINWYTFRINSQLTIKDETVWENQTTTINQSYSFRRDP